MKVKIISDGKRTTVVDAKTGERLEDVLAIEFVHRFNEKPEARITVAVPEIDAQVNARLMTVPDPFMVS